MVYRVMGGFWLNNFTSKVYLNGFSAFCAQMCPQRGMPVALWRTGLLLSFLCVCVRLEEDCVLGVVGRPVFLPCFYPDLLTLANYSIEWRREDEVVLRSVWEEDGNIQIWSMNRATVHTDATQTGNFSLELPAADPTQDNVSYSFFIISGENQRLLVCKVCLRIAASFSFPVLQREEAVEGEETSFHCRSSGGYPQPAVYWLINDTEEPPEGSVRTLAASLPDSHLFNITSHLTVNVSRDSSVTCVIENQSMNETLTSTSYGVPSGPVASRASEAMWIFSTALCAVVGVLVIVGVWYQIHLDRISKRKKKEYQETQRGYKRRRRYKEEAEAMTPEPKETNV
ncbi:ICOS ligand-like [Stegastes partitus]|uniref:ICOS ligand-like n=1 Tax=Stegastes partitus TaxID=144197 RepID=A0A9Y4JYZ7_9TELE|nr:PREDICTED: ICOS ligand-like [Stegastes partitus]